MAKAKGTKVSENEKARMYEYWLQCGSISKTAKKFKRNRATVSRYILELDTAQAIANYLSNI